MADRRTSTFEDLLAELNKNPEFREEYQRQKPYYDLLLEVVRRRKQYREELT